MAAKPIEAKAVAGPSAAAVVGYVAALVIAHNSAVRNYLGPDLSEQAPAILGAAFAAAAAWLAPHTHRPDLLEPAPRPVNNNAADAGPIAGAS